MSLASTNKLATYTEDDLLPCLLDLSAREDKPVAVWRLPGGGDVRVLIARNYQELDSDDLIEELEPGFIFAPFSRNSKRLFLEAEKLFAFEKGVFAAGDDPLQQAAVEWLSENQPALPKRPVRYSTIDLSVPSSTERAFMAMVSEAIKAIQSDQFEKVVPSRAQGVVLPESFDAVTAFQKLCRQYPEALISFVSIPGVGHWLGASPEMLISVSDKKIFRTVALAGTQAWQPGADPRSVSWTQKEIEEQALVERYIISCFKKVRLREYEEHGPKTVVAGNLMHLKSEFQVDMQATNFPLMGSVMLDLLHPTSAVCGMPLKPALEFIDNHEDYNRSFYSGYLGPVNIENSIELYVNLRCMQFSGNQGVFYAGAGVTIDSDPAKEWAETEMKLKTLLNIII